MLRLWLILSRFELFFFSVSNFSIIKVGTIVALAGVLAVFDGIAWVAAKTGKLVFDGVDAVYKGGKWVARKAYRGIKAGAIIFYNGVEWVAEVIVQGTKAIIDGIAAIYV